MNIEPTAEQIEAVRKILCQYRPVCEQCSYCAGKTQAVLAALRVAAPSPGCDKANAFDKIAALMPHIEGINDERDSVPLLLAIRRIVEGFTAAPLPWRGTAAVNDVIKERRRQVEVEGWSPEHDDGHTIGELASAGACYALYAGQPITAVPAQWRWSRQWWKPRDFRRNLVRGAALLIAEIERYDREVSRQLEQPLPAPPPTGDKPT